MRRNTASSRTLGVMLATVMVAVLAIAGGASPAGAGDTANTTGLSSGATAVTTGATGGTTGAPPPPLNEILFDGTPCEVVTLAWDANAQPYMGAPKGSQYKRVTLSMQYTPDPGWRVVDYTWGPLWNGAIGVATGVEVEGTGVGQTVHGGCYQPGIGGCNCTVHIRNDSTNTDSYPVFTSSCAVIGGPLTFSPESYSYSYVKDTFAFFNNGTELNYKNQGGQFSTVTLTLPDQDDNNRAKPYYLQYFGFDPTGSIPTDSQPPRAHLTVAATGQPPGTTYTWTVSDPTVFRTTNGGQQTDTSLVGVAVAAGSVTVKCNYSLTYSNLNGSASAQVDDDTDTTSNPRDPTITLVRTINCHEPHDTAKQSWKWYWPAGIVSVSQTGQVVPDGSTYAGECDEIAVTSQLGVHMPGVWIQERFTSTVPPDFTVNQGSGPSWSTAGTGDMAHLGNFYYDYIGYHWTLAAAPWQSFSLTHHYWAATKATTTGGIDVGTWTMTFAPGAPFQIGTVTHSK